MERHVWTYEEYLLESNLTDHAECELRRAGLFDDDSDYNGMIGKAVMALIKVFAEQGHSGFSAPMVVQLFTKVANYDTLTPITSDPEEWTDIADMCDGEKLWQNKRCSRMFSNDGGKTWWDVDEKGVHDLQEAMAHAACRMDEKIEDTEETRLWAVWAEKFYDTMFAEVNATADLIKKYREEFVKYFNMGASDELLHALKYFFNYRREELSDLKEQPLTEDYFPGGREKQRWFTLTEEKWKYFYDMIYKQLARDDQYAKDILETIKNKNFRCSERQYNYLKSVIDGTNKPSSYGPRN